MAPDTSTCPIWSQLGRGIDTTYPYFAISFDGSVVAVREGWFVHIYEVNNVSMEWKMIANPIDQVFTLTDQSRYKIALSSDGSVVGIADEGYDSSRGRITIFALHPDDGWTKLGAAIDGENIGDGAGASIALSADGTIIAIGSPEHDSSTGHVRIYTYNTKTQGWGQQGDSIRGEAVDDFSGESVAMSQDGSMVAIGANGNDGNGSSSGHVRVFEFDDQGSNWVQRGSDIDGEAINDQSGISIDLSADGSVVAVGAYESDGNGVDSGHVRVFKYDTDDGEWVQRGDDINGERADDESGDSVAMSADGTAIAIGARFNDNNYSQSGHTRVYDFDTNNQLWVKRGEDIDGEGANDQSGRPVAMSADGLRVGINGQNTNALRIFQWTLCPLPPSSMPTRNPDCADGETLLRLDLITDRFPKQTTWQVANLANKTILNGGPYDELFSAYQEAHCIDKKGCYQFTIEDSASDGICCKWFSGNGIYKLYFDSSIPIQEGGNFTGEESSILFGDTCPSPIPSMRPSSKPSTRPTTSMQPSELPTKLPSNQPSNSPTESLQPSNVPSNSPTEACPAGTFANFTSRLCQLCQPGTYQRTPSYKDRCINCQAGEYQPDEGGTECMKCKSGEFQPKEGQAQCLLCRAGGYCASEQTGTCDGGFIPCRVGTYNNETGQSNITACLPCPMSTYADGKEGLVQCPQCPFRLSSQGGESQCSFCAAQFYLADTLISQENLFRSPDVYCKACPPETNCTINTTLKTLQVPTGFWRDSLKSSTLYKCSSNMACNSSDTPQGNSHDYCIANHHGPLCESCQEENEYFNMIDGRCISCPNISQRVIIGCIILLLSIAIIIYVYVVISRSSWKKYLDSVSTFFYGLSLQAKMKILISFLQVVIAIGPVYGVRLDNEFVKFFNLLKFMNFNIFQFRLFPGECIGTMRSRIIILSVWPFALIIMLCLMLIVYSLIIQKIQSKNLCDDEERLDTFEAEEQELLTEASLKIDNDSSHIDVDRDSVRSVKPLALEVMVAELNLQSTSEAKNNDNRDHEHQSMESIDKNGEQSDDMSADIFHDYEDQSSQMHQSSAKVGLQDFRQLWSKLIYINVIVLYLVLPSVSNTIFDAITCRAFNTSDKEDTSRSYLVADWSINCDSNNDEFNGLFNLFWVMFTLWPFLVPLTFLGLLISIRKSVYSQRTTFLSEACSFLWRDYKEGMVFWEILDIYRKLILTGLVNLIDLEKGSTKILRLVTAIMVSALYLGILALARPYRQNTDLHLAFTSNVLLICFFSTGVIIHVCQDDDSCEMYIGSSINSFMATLVAVIMTCVMLVTTTVSIAYISITSVTAPTVRIVSTGIRPNMEVPSSCQNHVFLSHKWSTGQEKVHTLARMMQLYLQGVKLWLDVDDLQDITKLEESVNETAVFILFYSEGYFASVNCRREVYAAVAAKKTNCNSVYERLYCH